MVRPSGTSTQQTMAVGWDSLRSRASLATFESALSDDSFFVFALVAAFRRVRARVVRGNTGFVWLALFTDAPPAVADKVAGASWSLDDSELVVPMQTASSAALLSRCKDAGAVVTHDQLSAAKVDDAIVAFVDDCSARFPMSASEAAALVADSPLAALTDAFASELRDGLVRDVGEGYGDERVVHARHCEEAVRGAAAHTGWEVEGDPK